MKLRDEQSFLSLYFEPSAVEVASGEADSFASMESWQRETKRLGQVPTPEPIALLMARWVMSAKPRTVLDPAAGLGGLLAACRRLDASVALVAVERDAETLRRAKLSAPRGTKLILADYLRSDTGLFDGIIANPPYVKAHRLGYTEGDWRYLEERLGTPLDRLTNLYALFLLKIWQDLAPGGRAAVLVPAEFLNANFGHEIKERLVQAVRPPAIAVFPPTLNLFPDALTTSAVVFMEKAPPPQRESWLKLVESVDEAKVLTDKLCQGVRLTGTSGCIQLTTLNPRQKWLNALFTARPSRVVLPARVGDYFDCSRGIATGANDYFCLSRSEVREHGLTLEHVEPCLTKAADAEGLVFTREKFDALVARDRRCFLLNPVRSGPELLRYLKLGEQHGIPRRHLPSHRPVWYLPESRAPADILVAVFSRAFPKFILNRSGAKNLTCFHGLYAKPGWKDVSPAMTLFLNCSVGRQAFSEVNRFYGDGLNKLEPRDVEEMPCPLMPKLALSEAEMIVAELLRAEQLPLADRTARLDRLASRYFEITPQRAELGG